MENKKPSGPISAVIWDFDDTLVDSRPARARALGQVFLEASVDDLDAERFLLDLPQNTLAASLACLAESQGYGAGLFSRFKSIYWTKAPGSLKLYPGVEAVLDRMERSGLNLALVTQKVRAFEVEGVKAGVSVEMEDVGLSDRFRVVIGVDDVSEPKPHPEGILKVIESLGVFPEQAMMVGDAVTDIQAAKAAGCWSCLATWGVPDGAYRAKRASPDLIAEMPEDVLRFCLQEDE